MGSKLDIVIFGNREIALLARYYFANDSDHAVIAFTVDDEFVEEDILEGLPVIGFSELQKKYPSKSYHVFVAISYQKLNRTRENIYKRVKHAGYRMPSFVSSRSVTWPDLVMGENCLILENQTIQPNVTLGNNVFLWSGNHIGHGSKIDDHAYLASQIVVSGHCHIGKRCFIGVNSTIRDFTKIGDDSFIAMGASVTKNISAGSVVVGPQSTIFEKDDKRARILVRKEFGV